VLGHVVAKRCAVLFVAVAGMATSAGAQSFLRYTYTGQTFAQVSGALTASDFISFSFDRADLTPIGTGIQYAGDFGTLALPTAWSLTVGGATVNSQTSGATLSGLALNVLSSTAQSLSTTAACASVAAPGGWSLLLNNGNSHGSMLTMTTCARQTYASESVSVPGGSGFNELRYGTWSVQAINPSVSTVPEPGTWALLGTGLLAVGGIAARRKRTAV